MGNPLGIDVWVIIFVWKSGRVESHVYTAEPTDEFLAHLQQKYSGGGDGSCNLVVECHCI